MESRSMFKPFSVRNVLQLIVRQVVFELDVSPLLIALRVESRYNTALIF